jgi:hypothetical protein
MPSTASHEQSGLFKAAHRPENLNLPLGFLGEVAELTLPLIERELSELNLLKQK